MEKIGERVLDLVEEDDLDESMPGWKPTSSEKSKLKRAFDQLQKDLKTVQFDDEGKRGLVDDFIKSAWKEVQSPGWGAAIKDLEAAMKMEAEGRGLSSVEDTATIETYLLLMEVLGGLTRRLARADGRYFVYQMIKDKMDEMKGRGLSQTDIDNSYFEMEYPWTKSFGHKMMGELFKAAQDGFAEGMGILSDAVLKMEKKV